jgi:hypothetical protein
VSDWSEIEALGRLGGEGVQKLDELFRGSEGLGIRIEAARALGLAGAAKSFGAINDLFQDLAATGSWHHLLTAADASARQVQLRQYLFTLSEALVLLDAPRGHSVVRTALFDADDEVVVGALSGFLRMIEMKQPQLVGMAESVESTSRLRAPPTLPAPGDLPHVPFLAACDLWRAAVRARDDAPPEVRARLLESGDTALAAAVELCYPAPNRPSRDELAACVRLLASDRGRTRAVAVLALGQYPPRLLSELLAGQESEIVAYGRAIEAYRRGGPWWLDCQRDLLGMTTTVLELHWPLEKTRAFALANLDRLAKIGEVEHGWNQRPLGPLLASIRYSDDPAERQKLADFVKVAAPGAARTAEIVMQYGLSGSGRHNMPAYWKKLPQ